MTVLLALILAPFAILTLCFAVELFAGLKSLSAPIALAGSIPGAAIVVPAHNEAAGLAPRLAALKESASPVRVLLVADNCTDSTADIARRIGVEVIERFDSTLRGKGFALDFAKRHLASDPPQVVIIVDADCAIDAGSAQALIAACSSTGSPCQAINLQRPQRDSSPAVQISTFAFFVKNVIRQRALKRLSGRVQLLGTGMALPWRLFESAHLATSSIVEDIKLGHELAEAGHAPILVENATVWSEAETKPNTLAQRRRWEGGFLREALRQGPSRFLNALRKGDAKGLWASLSIMIPPVALLVSVDVAVLGLAALLIWTSGAPAAVLLILALPIMLAAIGLALAWKSGGSRFVSLGALLRAPFYVAWKLPMYLGFARNGAPKDWLRTDRG